MKLVSFLNDGKACAGILEGDEVYATGIPGLQPVIVNRLNLRSVPGTWKKLSSIRLDVPLRPSALLGTGSNYADHLEERVPASGGSNAPKRELEFFVKAGMTIAGLEDALKLDPGLGKKIDQETELGLVIGAGCPRNVSEREAQDYVFGYLVINDLTARDKQVRFMPSGGSFMVLGASKNFDGATRFSHYILTADEVPDVYNLGIRTYLNGELKQNNSTRNVINTFSRMISFFSEGISLPAGAIITTGTPGGTGWGQDLELGGKGYVPPDCTPSRYLKVGDEVRSVVEGVGELTFRVE
jgi:2-keto-4-pentenoate hydratase/2-oxohepta-3-ene-1,7-dioic acid hydratase in catechol pathway